LMTGLFGNRSPSYRGVYWKMDQLVLA